MFEKKYPYCQGLFIFDNAPSHKKKADDALNVDRMNVRDGEKLPFMHDTIYNGTVQQMTTAEGPQNCTLGEMGGYGRNEFFSPQRQAASVPSKLCNLTQYNQNNNSNYN